MTDTIFPDISEFQPHADIARIRGITGAIAARLLYGIKADKNMPQRINDIRAQKFDAVIWYIFMRPPANGPTVAQQFAAVRNLLPELLPGESVCVDWEADTNKLAPTAAERDALLTMLDNYYGQPQTLYGSASSLSGYNAPRPVWVASYGVSTEPKVAHAIWQYTNGVYTSGNYKPVLWPGIGVCDTNVFHGTSQELGALLSSQKVHQRMQLNKPIIGIIGTKSGGGYWLYAGDGGVFAFGDARAFGDNPVPGLALAAPIVGATVTPSEQGLTLVGSDGGVFCLGDAVFHGSVPGLAA